MKTSYIIKYEKKNIIQYLEESFFNLKPGTITLILYRYKYIHNTLPLIRQFLGICISKKYKGINSNIILRNVIDKSALECQFNVFSPSILSIKKIKVRKGNYIRNKLYYLRNRVSWESTILDENISW